MGAVRDEALVAGGDRTQRGVDVCAGLTRRETRRQAAATFGDMVEVEDVADGHDRSFARIGGVDAQAARHRMVVRLADTSRS